MAGLKLRAKLRGLLMMSYIYRVTFLHQNGTSYNYSIHHTINNPDGYRLSDKQPFTLTFTPTVTPESPTNKEGIPGRSVRKK